MTEEEKNEYWKKLAEQIAKDVQENPCKMDSKIFKDIEQLKRKKPILLIGKDKKLIKHAVNWIRFTHPKVYRPVTRTLSLFARYSDNPISPAISSVKKGEIILTEYSCIGKTETKIEDDLFSPDYSLISDYKSGEMLFVRRLNSKRILERLADSVEGYCNGVLIINVPSMDIVPQELLDQFDPIYLEPDKQNIPQERTESDNFNWSINSDKSEIYCNGKLVAKLPGIPFKIFKCLYKNKGKFVKNEILEKCWDNKPEYDHFLVDTMNELETKLKNGLKKLEGINVQGKIIESKKNNKRKIIAYKLPT